MTDFVSERGPSIAFIELSSIAKGVEATDAMLKKAAVDLLLTTIVPRGKYLVMVGGAVADVDSALRAGLEVGGSTGRYSSLIQSVHPQLPPAIKGRVKVPQIEAVGLIETKEVASAIFAGDAAAKDAQQHISDARTTTVA